MVGNRTVDLNATVAMDMIWCPPGTFMMGSPTDEVGRGSDETELMSSLTKRILPWQIRGDAGTVRGGDDG